jgi:hypothetical protein
MDYLRQELIVEPIEFPFMSSDAMLEFRVSGRLEKPSRKPSSAGMIYAFTFL